MRSVADNQRSGPALADGELDVGGLGRAISRRRRWIYGSTLACFLASTAFVTLVTPKYTAATSVLIENQESFFTRPTAPNSNNDQLVTIDPETVASQVQVVMSRDLARKAIERLGLHGNVEFDPSAKPPGLLSSIAGIFSSGSRSAAPEDRLLDNFADALNVFAVVKTRVLQIEFSSRDPDLAARGSNVIADLYIESQADAKRQAAHDSAASLANVVADLRSKATKAEAEAEEFRAANGIAMGANNMTFNGQHITDLNTQLSLAKAAQAEAQAKAHMLRDMLKSGRLGDVSEVANNELIRRLSESRATMRAQIASESRTLLPGHPRIKELTAQADELDGQIRSAVERAARGLENDAKVAGVRVDNLQADVAQQKKQMSGSSGDEARAQELDLVAKQLKEQLQANVGKYQEALARESSQSTPGDARVVSRAIPPQLPSFPKKIPIVAFATFAGALLSTGTVISAELLSGRAYATAAETAGATAAAAPSRERTPGRTPPRDDIDPFPRIARVKGGDRVRRSRRPATDAPPDALAGLAARLAAAPAGEFAQRILVASEGSDVSAREVATALGRALAADRRVILVDLDGAEQGEDADLGFGELLTGEADFEDVIQREPRSRLHLVGAGCQTFDYSEACDDIFDALSRTYDFLIVVAPPLRDSELGIAVAPDSDCAVLACPGEPDPLALRELAHAGAGEITPITWQPKKAGRTAA